MEMRAERLKSQRSAPFAEENGERIEKKREYVDNAHWRCLQKGLFLKTGNRVDRRAGKRDSQLKPVAAFDLICVIYILPKKNDLQPCGAGRKSQKMPTLVVGEKPYGKSRLISRVVARSRLRLKIHRRNHARTAQNKSVLSLLKRILCLVNDISGGNNDVPPSASDVSGADTDVPGMVSDVSPLDNDVLSGNNDGPWENNVVLTEQRCFVPVQRCSRSDQRCSRRRQRCSRSDQRCSRRRQRCSARGQRCSATKTGQNRPVFPENRPCLPKIRPDLSSNGTRRLK